MRVLSKPGAEGERPTADGPSPRPGSSCSAVGKPSAGAAARLRATATHQQRRPSLGFVLLVGAVSALYALCGERRCLASDSPPVLRVGLLWPEEESVNLSSGMALLEAALLERGTIELVERGRIDEVLAELNLSAASGSASDGERLKVGRLIGADLLLWAGQPADPPAGAARVVAMETRYGLRLADAVVEERSDAETIRGQLRGVFDLGVRRVAEPIRLIVAVPPFRNDGFSFKKDHLRHASAATLERVLASVPGLRLAEIKQAERIASEIRMQGSDGLDRPLPRLWLGRFDGDSVGPDGGPTRIGVTLESRLRADIEASVTRTFDSEEAFIGGLREMATELLDKVQRGFEVPEGDRSADADALYRRAQGARLLGYRDDAYRLLWAALLADSTHEGALLMLSEIPRKEDAEAIAERLGAHAVSRPEKPIINKGNRHLFLRMRSHDRAAALLVDVLKAKSVHQVRDRTCRHIDYVCQHAADIYQRDEYHELLLALAPHYWGSHKTFARHFSMCWFSNYGVTSPDEIEDEVKRLEAIDTAFCRAAAEEVRERWDRKLNYRRLSTPPVDPEGPVEPEGPWEARLVEIEMPVRFVSGWETADQFELFWGYNGAPEDCRLFRLDGSRRWEELGPIVKHGDELAQAACFDGRHAWAATPDADGPRVVAIEPTSGERIDFTAADGLPDTRIDAFSVATVGPGDVVAVASVFEGRFVRSWVGRLGLDDAGQKSVRVLHTQRDQLGKGDGRAFVCAALNVWPEPTSRILVYRGNRELSVNSRDVRLLGFDLETGTPIETPAPASNACMVSTFPVRNPPLWRVPTRQSPRRPGIELLGSELYHFDPVGRWVKDAAWVPGTNGAVVGDRLYQVGFNDGVLVTDLTTREVQPYRTEPMATRGIGRYPGHGSTIATRTYGPAFCRDFSRLYQLQVLEDGVWRGFDAPAVVAPSSP